MIIEGFDDSNRFQKRVKQRRKERQMNKRRIMSGTGPMGSIMVYFIDEIVIKLLSTIYNFFLDITMDGINFTQQFFFSDFKGFLAGKLKTKQGSCFEYTFFRYFMTIMLPPMGIFISRGLSSWYNILLCGFLCFFKYIPGLIYAIIVMHNAPYANRYRDMKRRKLQKARPPSKFATDKTVTPLIFFGLAILITGIAIYYSIKSNPNQTLLIGNPLNYLQNYYNNAVQSYNPLTMSKSS